VSSSPARRVLLGLSIGAGVMMLGAPAAWYLARRAASEPPPPLYAMPAFALTNEQGQPVSSSDLDGQVLVASFIFTRCPSVCPRLTARMARVQRMVEDLPAVHLVSFTVDPAYDTPERLREYAGRFGQDPARWTFLTGDVQAVKDAVQAGFRIGYKGEGVDITHGEHMVLVDPQGQIRAYYGTTDEDLERLVRDARSLAARAGRS
jgi:protein SCO1/2